MKKWDEPKLVELALKNTNESGCNIDFDSDATTYSAYEFRCNTGGYKAGGGILGYKCIHYKCGKCTYVPTSSHS